MMPACLFSFPVLRTAAVLVCGFSLPAAAVTLTVTTDAASGPGSLHQALLDASAVPAELPAVVDFDPVFFAVARTLVLNETLPAVRRSMVIEGPPEGGDGQLLVTLSGDRNGSGALDAGDGPGLALEVPALAEVTLRRLAFTGCRSTGHPGGAVFFRPAGPATLLIERCDFTGNEGRWGGAVSMGGPGHQVTLRDCVFTGNRSTLLEGGALHLGSTPALVERCEFRQNVAPAGGGAIHSFHGAAELRGCLFDSNEALPVGNGGAVSARVGLRVSGSTFVNNKARAGGALFLNQMSAPDPGAAIENSTFSANIATGAGGGAIYAVGTDAMLRHCTFTLNHANRDAAADPHASGGAIAVPGAANVNRLRLHNCVMAGNLQSGPGAAVGADVHGPATSLISLGGNVLGVGDAVVAAFNQPGDQSGTLAGPLAAGLGPLEANGGMLPTHAPSPESPVVDTGVPGPAPVIDVDQRGVSRPAGAAADAGAVELVPLGG